MNDDKQFGYSDNIFTLSKVSYYYPRSDWPALHNLNLEVREGEFLLLIGRSGSGKSTLARAMCALIPDFYGGDMTGQIDFLGVPLTDWPKNQVAEKVGIVFQEPSKQLFYKNVERDIAFGLENLGFDNDLMHRRVAEVLDFLNLNSLRRRDSRLISGGEQQKIALAGVLAMGPQVLILDEPTSQLDPVAAAGFLDLLRDLNQDAGVTVILIEQRLDKAFNLADRVIVMEAGEIIYQGEKTEQLRWAFNNNYPLVPAVPAIFAAGANNAAVPMTIKEGRIMLGAMGADENVPPCKCETSLRPGEPLVQINKLTFAYPDSLPAIKDLDLKIWPGEFVALIGSNGAGKSTLLQVIAGLLGGYKGNVRVGDVSGKRLKAENLKHQVAYLPQNLDDFFLADTVVEDIMLAGEKAKEPPDYWLEALKLMQYRDDDPRKLSTGEKQRAALAAILASDPALILLDEPTTGVDREHKKKLGKLLVELCRRQKTIVLVTHDIDFVSEYAERIVFMHEGKIVAEGPVNEQIPKNIFYTSQAARLFQPFDRSIINEAQATERIRVLLERSN
jgi:energy-coupling factor transporter ATP-binding protein EcfA2